MKETNISLSEEIANFLVYFQLSKKKLDENLITLESNAVEMEKSKVEIFEMCNEITQLKNNITSIEKIKQENMTFFENSQNESELKITDLLESVQTLKM